MHERRIWIHWIQWSRAKGTGNGLLQRLQRIANGDESAVREVIDEYGDLIWRLANRYLDRAKHEIDDAIQDVFVEIWLSAKRFDPEKGSEAAFIATLAHRRLIDHQRKAMTYRKNLRDHQVEKMSTEPSPGIGSIRSAVHRQLAVEVADRFEHLPEVERQALWLALHRGMTHRQIGEAMQSPIGTVKTRLRNGLLRLVKQMRPDEMKESEVREGGVA